MYIGVAISKIHHVSYVDALTKLKGKIMTKTIITSSDAPEAIGPYSQAVQIGNLLFTSGAIPLDPKTGEIVGETAAEQAEQVLKNLVAVLKAANATTDNVVKTTVFLSDMNDFVEINKVYSSYFSKDFPARSCVAVKTLPKNVKIEIEAIAAV